MKNKFKIVIMICIIVLGIVFISNKVNMKSITTDSGFDVDYGGGSSSSSSDDYSSRDDYRSRDNSYYSSNSNTYSSHSASSGGNLSFSHILLIIIGTLVPSVFTLRICSPSLFKKREQSTKNGNYYYYHEFNKIIITPREKQIIDEAYKIFIDVQTAWMNFDYDKLRELVTDDLYNMYLHYLLLHLLLLYNFHHYYIRIFDHLLYF